MLEQYKMLDGNVVKYEITTGIAVTLLINHKMEIILIM